MYRRIETLTGSAVILVNPGNRCIGREGDLLHKIGIAKEFAGNQNDICLVFAENLREKKLAE